MKQDVEIDENTSKFTGENLARVSEQNLGQHIDPWYLWLWARHNQEAFDNQPKSFSPQFHRFYASPRANDLPANFHNRPFPPPLPPPHVLDALMGSCRRRQKGSEHCLHRGSPPSPPHHHPPPPPHHFPHFHNHHRYRHHYHRHGLHGKSGPKFGFSRNDYNDPPSFNESSSEEKIKSPENEDGHHYASSEQHAKDGLSIKDSNSLQYSKSTNGFSQCKEQDPRHEIVSPDAHIKHNVDPEDNGANSCKNDLCSSPTGEQDGLKFSENFEETSKRSRTIEGLDKNAPPFKRNKSVESQDIIKNGSVSLTISLSGSESTEMRKSGEKDAHIETSKTMSTESNTKESNSISRKSSSIMKENDDASSCSKNADCDNMEVEASMADADQLKQSGFNSNAEVGERVKGDEVFNEIEHSGNRFRTEGEKYDSVINGNASPLLKLSSGFSNVEPLMKGSNGRQGLIDIDLEKMPGEYLHLMEAEIAKCVMNEARKNVAKKEAVKQTKESCVNLRHVISHDALSITSHHSSKEEPRGKMNSPSLDLPQKNTPAFVNGSNGKNAKGDNVDSATGAGLPRNFANNSGGSKQHNLGAAGDPRLVKFLNRIGLADYVKCMTDAWVDMDELPSISEEDLIEMGLSQNACTHLKQRLSKLKNGRDAELEAFMESIGLSQFMHIFVDGFIFMDDLHNMEEKRLLELGLPLGPSKRLMRALARAKRGSDKTDTSNGLSTNDKAQNGGNLIKPSYTHVHPSHNIPQLFAVTQKDINKGVPPNFGFVSSHVSTAPGGSHSGVGNEMKTIAEAITAAKSAAEKVKNYSGSSVRPVVADAATELASAAKALVDLLQHHKLN